MVKSLAGLGPAVHPGGAAARAPPPGLLQENNFKAVLESIRDLMNEHHAAMPDWLLDIFLGYGDPAAASYHQLPNALASIDFKDTFLDEAHLRASFPGTRSPPLGLPKLLRTQQAARTCAAVRSTLLSGRQHAGAALVVGSLLISSPGPAEHDVEVEASTSGAPAQPPFQVDFLPPAAATANGTAKPGKRKRGPEKAVQVGRAVHQGCSALLSSPDPWLACMRYERALHAACCHQLCATRSLETGP